MKSPFFPPIEVDLRSPWLFAMAPPGGFLQVRTRTTEVQVPFGRSHRLGDADWQCGDCLPGGGKLMKTVV